MLCVIFNVDFTVFAVYKEMPIGVHTSIHEIFPISIMSCLKHRAMFDAMESNTGAHHIYPLRTYGKMRPSFTPNSDAHHIYPFTHIWKNAPLIHPQQ